MKTAINCLYVITSESSPQKVQKAKLLPWRFSSKVQILMLSCTLCHRSCKRPFTTEIYSAYISRLYRNPNKCFDGRESFCLRSVGGERRHCRDQKHWVCHSTGDPTDTYLWNIVSEPGFFEWFFEHLLTLPQMWPYQWDFVRLCFLIGLCWHFFENCFYSDTALSCSHTDFLALWTAAAGCRGCDNVLPRIIIQNSLTFDFVHRGL
jgi:hypothetical protein